VREGWEVARVAVGTEVWAAVVLEGPAAQAAAVGRGLAAGAAWERGVGVTGAKVKVGEGCRKRGRQKEKRNLSKCTSLA
jgi:hypothetical protein